MSFHMVSRRVLTLAGLVGSSLVMLSLVWVLLGCQGIHWEDPVVVPGLAAELSISEGGFASSDYSQWNVGPPLSGIARVQSEIACRLETTSKETYDTTWDNHSFGTAKSVADYNDLSLISSIGDVPGSIVPTEPDFFRLDGDQFDIGGECILQAQPVGLLEENYNLGIRVYDIDKNEILADVDTSSHYAKVAFTLNDDGPYYIKVFQASEQCTGGIYRLYYTYKEPAPTPSPTATAMPGPTATPQPGATWMAGFDQYEPNFDYNIATTIAPGIVYSMNFVPWGGGDVDNDFLKIRVKPGLQLTCETSDLDPAVDPRMVFYSGPGEQYYVMANDDIALGDFNSRLSYYVTYEGYVYVLIGQGSRMVARDTANSDYSVRCDLSVPGDPTPQPGQTPIPDKAAPIPTPQTPVADTPTPSPTVEEDVALTFRLVTRPEPPTVTPEPSGFRTFRVIVYFDANQDGVMGAGEGVTGFFVQVLSPDGQGALAQGYTDDQGQLSFTVPTIGTVRVVVPLLGVDRLIEASKPEVRVRIAPPSLPDTIP